MIAKHDSVFDVFESNELCRAIIALRKELGLNALAQEDFRYMIVVTSDDLQTLNALCRAYSDIVGLRTFTKGICVVSASKEELHSVAYHYMRIVNGELTFDSESRFSCYFSKSLPSDSISLKRAKGFSECLV